MSNPYTSRQSGRSYANVAAGTLPRTVTSPPETPLDQTPNVATYVQQTPYIASPPDVRSSSQDIFDWRGLGATDSDLTTAERKLLGREPQEVNEMLPVHRAKSFFVPSYLEGTRYIDRLKHEIQEQDDNLHHHHHHHHHHQETYSTPPTHLHQQQRFSHAVAMYRGVAQTVRERLPPQDYNGPPKLLPTCWSDEDKAAGLEVLGDGAEVRLGGIPKKIMDEAASVRTDYPVPKGVGLYYYEITVLSRGKDALVAIGFSSSKTVLTRLPGWEADSYAYHGDDGDFYSGSSNGRPYGDRFSSYDVIGCGVNFRSNKIFFTKNGVLMGLLDVKLPNADLYPSVGIKRTSEHVKANFGRRPFVFDIDGMMKNEARDVRLSAVRQGVEKLHPPDDENTLVQKLVSQYLAHEGYVATSRAFLDGLREQKRLAPSTSAQSSSSLENSNGTEDDQNAINRQSIRQAVLYGDINKALKLTQSCYPKLLQQDKHRDIYFQLRCRRFIEMISRHTDLSMPAQHARDSERKQQQERNHDQHHNNGSSSSSYGNGHASSINNNHNTRDTQMELDDQIQRETLGIVEEDTDMDGMSDPTSSMKQNDLITAVIEYGQGLKAEFDTDSRPDYKKELDEIFALMAYENPRTSPVAHLLDKNCRSSIAEALNGAILVSLGQPSSAALEKLCVQTEDFLDKTASSIGGSAAFVNLKKNIMLC